MSCDHAGNCNAVTALRVDMVELRKEQKEDIRELRIDIKELGRQIDKESESRHNKLAEETRDRNNEMKKFYIFMGAVMVMLGGIQTVTGFL